MLLSGEKVTQKHFHTAAPLWRQYESAFARSRGFFSIEKAFYGTCDKYLSKNPDGSLQLGGICLVAGLGGKDHRDGSLAYYFSEPVVCNDAKGVGPLVLAYTEMIARKN